MQTRVTGFKFTFFHAIFTMPLIGQNQQNDLTLARSRNVNGHVSIPLDRAFPTGGPWDRTKPISPAFLKDIGP